MGLESLQRVGELMTVRSTSLTTRPLHFRGCGACSRRESIQLEVDGRQLVGVHDYEPLLTPATNNLA